MPPSWVDALKLSHRGMLFHQFIRTYYICITCVWINFMWLFPCAFHRGYGCEHKFANWDMQFSFMIKLGISVFLLLHSGKKISSSGITCIFFFSYVWVLLTDFQMRCPHGKKTKVYKRAKLEKFAHYLMKDGLISRLSVYEDRECKLYSLLVTCIYLICFFSIYTGTWSCTVISEFLIK